MSLVLIAEWHARGLYLEAGYPSMFKYCVGALHMSEDEAFKRIRIARAGREFPAVFAAIAEHRLHMTGALLLAPHLKPENVVSLLDAATHKSKEEIELLLAHRFPRQDVPERVEPISASAEPQPAPPFEYSGACRIRYPVRTSRSGQFTRSRASAITSAAPITAGSRDTAGAGALRCAVHHQPGRAR